NISLVLDKSGSMSGGKLYAAREAAALLVERMRPRDVASVVAFDSEVTVVSPPMSSQHAQVASAIRGIRSGDTTNLAGGWKLGYELASASLSQSNVNRIVLLTDGKANVGVRDPVHLAEMCAVARRSGVRTTTIGFGADYDERLLRRMAEGGGGT